MNALSVLKKYFGFEEFRPLQEDIIQTINSGKDCLVLMPTGGGKSVCYQVPALMSHGLTVVISPLIALMKDQVDALKLIGAEAAFLNSSLDNIETGKLMEELKSNKVKILYIAPERLSVALNSFITLLKKLNVTLFAIDEAHCISHWGHDFRPDYLTLSKLKTEFPTIPVIALTATADQLTRQDIIDKLLLKDPKVFISSFNRSNIRYMIEEKDDHYQRIIDFVEANKEYSGIIYCLSRRNTEEMAVRLRDKGFNAQPYHAGLDSSLRSQRQEQFKRDELKIIVATIAFGMGIDKSNVRYVIHASIPKNIESYYQETGRAGRDGLPSQALLFYSGADVIKLRSFIAGEDDNPQRKIMMRKLSQMEEFCLSVSCRRKYLLNYFDEKFNAPCNNCDVCLNTKAIQFDTTMIAQKALSAVKRLNERFGISYVINFLKGSASSKIHEQHRYLPTFGKGAEYTMDEWRSYFRQLIDLNLLEMYGDYSVLRITSKGQKVLYENEQVLLTRPQERKLARKERVEKYANTQAAGVYHNRLFEELQELRSQIASTENVPAYLVFNDNTLSELATFLPFNSEELKHIAGFGTFKINKYGDAFLNVIRKYCESNKLDSRMAEKEAMYRKKNSRIKNGPGDTMKITYDLYQKGHDINQIAAIRKLKESTVTEHLLQFITTGEINVLKFVSKEKLKKISALIEEHGDLSLTNLKELSVDCSYSEIRAVINYRLRSTSVIRTKELGQSTKE